MSIYGRLEDATRRRLPNPSKWEIVGASKSGEGTGFYLPAIDTALDAGFKSTLEPRLVCLTHCHPDHCQNLPRIYHCQSGKMFGDARSQRELWAPESTLELVQPMLRATLSAARGEEVDPSDLFGEYRIRPMGVAAGQTHRLPGKGGVSVEIHRCVHRVESVGFGFVTQKSRLKPEHQGKSKEEIRDLVKSGETVAERVDVPELLFFGDTAIEALTEESNWEKYPVVFVEATHFPLGRTKTSIAETKGYGHIHFDELLPVIISHPDTYFYIIHTSIKYSTADLRAFESGIKDSKGPANFTIWLES